MILVENRKYYFDICLIQHRDTIDIKYDISGEP